MSGTIDITLIVLSVHASMLNTIMQDNSLASFDEKYDYEETTYYIFYECRGQSLAISDLLSKHGIAFTQEWTDDCGNSGINTQRFTSRGKSIYKDLDNSKVNPDAEQCLNLIDKPVELREYILEHQASRLFLPWDNQEQNGKLYMARQLINA